MTVASADMATGKSDMETVAKREDGDKSEAEAAVEEYRAKLAEKRRMAREKAEREAEEKLLRQEQLRFNLSFSRF